MTFLRSEYDLSPKQCVSTREEIGVFSDRNVACVVENIQLPQLDGVVWRALSHFSDGHVRGKGHAFEIVPARQFFFVMQDDVRSAQLDRSGDILVPGLSRPGFPRSRRQLAGL
jgi:hypothetical protein